ncbi:MAG: hypothetical protein GKR89_37395 [Candidatus Latescibacteria bacterium]|nr:hypothetical protein [Candidatus Latescibacterota bacterium]
MSANLPDSPSLRQLKIQAKEVLRRVRAQDAETLAHVKRWHYKDLAPNTIGLQDAQLVLARSYGFSTWEKLLAATSSDDPRNKLARAIDAGQVETVRQILAADPDLVHRDAVTWKRGTMKPLPYAVADNAGGPGQVEIARLLLDAGADPQANNHFPLIKSLAGPCADLFLELGADVNVKIGDWGPLISFPAEDHNVEGLRWLLANGADPDLVYPNTKCKGTALEVVLLTYSRSDRMHACVEILAENGAQHSDGPEIDIHRGRLDLLQARLQQDPQIPSRHSEFMAHREDYGGAFGGAPLQAPTLLHICAEYNEVEAARLLLQHGSAINARAAHPDSNQTPIYHAVCSNFNWCFPMLEFLVKQGADLAVRSTLRVANKVLKDVTPLGYALNYPNDINGGPGSGKRRKNTDPHENVIDLLKSHGAPE